jgi:hypothetical protein
MVCKEWAWSRCIPAGVGVTGGEGRAGTLLGTGGVGIFHGFASACGRYSSSLVENIDIVFFAVRRRKSARPASAAAPCVGIGSEMIGRFSNRCGVLGLLLRGFLPRPVAPTQRNTASAPTISPGISPAKKGPTGNGSHLQSSSAVELLLADRAVGVEVVLETLLVLEADEAVVLAELADVLDDVGEPPGNEPAKRALSRSILHWNVSSLFLAHV